LGTWRSGQETRSGGGEGHVSGTLEAGIPEGRELGMEWCAWRGLEMGRNFFGECIVLKFVLCVVERGEEEGWRECNGCVADLKNEDFFLGLGIGLVWESCVYGVEERSGLAV